MDRWTIIVVAVVPGVVLAIIVAAGLRWIVLRRRRQQEEYLPGDEAHFTRRLTVRRGRVVPQGWKNSTHLFSDTKSFRSQQSSINEETIQRTRSRSPFGLLSRPKYSQYAARHRSMEFIEHSLTSPRADGESMPNHEYYDPEMMKQPEAVVTQHRDSIASRDGISISSLPTVLNGKTPEKPVRPQISRNASRDMLSIKEEPEKPELEETDSFLKTSPHDMPSPDEGQVIEPADQLPSTTRPISHYSQSQSARSSLAISTIESSNESFKFPLPAQHLPQPSQGFSFFSNSTTTFGEPAATSTTDRYFMENPDNGQISMVPLPRKNSKTPHGLQSTAPPSSMDTPPSKGTPNPSKSFSRPLLPILKTNVNNSTTDAFLDTPISSTTDSPTNGRRHLYRGPLNISTTPQSTVAPSSASSSAVFYREPVSAPGAPRTIQEWRDEHQIPSLPALRHAHQKATSRTTKSQSGSKEKETATSTVTAVGLQHSANISTPPMPPPPSIRPGPSRSRSRSRSRLNPDGPRPNVLRKSSAKGAVSR